MTNTNYFAKEIIGLKRIVLINSYIKSENNTNNVFEFDFNTHSQVNGANGSGKTSLLKLIPFFYGSDPGKITSLSNVKKSFSGYYLPTSDSHIVFEYTSNENKTVHVIVSNASNNANSTTLAYKFIPCEFSTLDFIKYDEVSNTYIAKSWLEYKDTLRKKDIKTEAIITSVEAYRNVIQNIPNSDNAFLRKKYSLSTGRKELKYIDSIALSLITGHISFDNIKLLLTEIIKKNHQNIKLQLKQNDINSWCDATSAYNEVAKLNKEFNTVISKYQNYKQAKNILETCKEYLNYYKIKLEDDISETQSQLQKEKEAKKNFIEINGEKTEDIRKDLVRLDELVKIKEQEIIDIEDKEEYYQNIDAHIWTDKFKNQSKLKSSLEKDKDVLNSMSAKYNDIDIEFTRKVEKAKLEKNENNAKLTKSLNELNLDKNHKIHNIQISFNEQLASNKAKEASLIHDIEKEIVVRKGELAKNEFAIKNISIPAELEEQLNAVNKQLSEFQTLARKKERELRELQSKLIKLEAQRNHCVTSCSSCIQKIQTFTSDLNSVNLKLAPENKSLISFLNEKSPNWKNTIGKVLNEDLLKNEELDPCLIEDKNEVEIINDNTFIIIGNLKINISNVSSSQKDDPELLEKKRFLQAEIEKEKEKETNFKNEIKLLEEQIKELNNKISIISSEEDYDLRISELEQQISSLQHKTTTHKKNAEQILNAEISTLNKTIKQLNQKINAVKEEYQEINEELNSNHLANKSDIETNYKNEVDSINSLIDANEKQYKTNINEYNLIKKSKMLNQGIDPDLLDTLTNRINDTQKEIESINEHEDLVNEYTTWLNTVGKLLAQKRSELPSLKADRANAKQVLEQKESEHKKKIKLFDEELQRLNNSIEQHEKNLKEIRSRTEKLTELSFNSEKAKECDWPVNSLISDINHRTDEYISNENAMLDAINSINNCMISIPNSELGKLWFQRDSIESSEFKVDESATEKQRQIFVAASVTQLIVENILPKQKQLLLENGQNITHMITEYYNHLRDFDNRIKSFSNRISRIVSNNLQFEAFDEFSIHLETRLKKIAGWTYIEKIAEGYNEWNSNGKIKGELPSETLVQDIRLFANQFSNGQLENDLSDLFNIVFEVIENGKHKKATTARELEDLSSNGLTFLLICALYISLINEARDNQEIEVHWPVDEMSKLSNTNIHLLMKVMNQNNIVMVSAAPDLSPAVAIEFKNIYRIAKDGVYTNNAAVDPIGAIIEEALNKDELGVNINA